MQLDQAIAPPERLLGVAGDGLGGAVAQEARVGWQVGARASAQQAVERDAGDLARDVPERDVEARQRVHGRPVAADPVQEPLNLVVDRGDLARIAADAQGSEQGVDDRARGREDTMTERLAPADDSRIGLEADEQHVDAGPRPAAEHRRGPVDQHREIENEGLNPSDLHAERASRLP